MLLNRKQKETYMGCIEDEVIYIILQKAIDKEWTLETHRSDFDGWYDHVLYIPDIPYEDLITEDFAREIINSGR